MPRVATALSALEVGRLTDAPGLHFVGVVPGLMLQVGTTGAASWVLRATVGGKRRDIGLGSYPGVTLAGAYEAARDARKKIKDGIDPVAERQANRSKLIAAQIAQMPFTEAAGKYIEAHEAGWKSSKSAAQWTSSLTMYAYPIIGKIGVADIEMAHVLRVLEPIWTVKTETASRIRGRIESILDWATVRGYRKGENPARWKGHLEHLLAARADVQEVKHHAALPFPEIGSFMVELRKSQGMGARALEFAILTACRSGEARGATWSEIDLETGSWEIPVERMKAKRAHRVPLSAAALELLNALPRIAGTDLVFPSAKNTPLSDMTLTGVLKRMGRRDITAHGFRSSFRDWAGETTAYDRQSIEHALAHQLPDKAEASYARGSQYDKRRRLMEEWARFCSEPTSAANVTPIRGVAA